MGLDFDIIIENGDIIDRFSIKWLRDYDNDFLNLLYSNYSIEYIELKCKNKMIDINKKIYVLLETKKYFLEENLNQKKEIIKNIIDVQNNIDELNEIINYFADLSWLESDIEYYEGMFHKYNSFNEFLTKYQNFKYQISF